MISGIQIIFVLSDCRIMEIQKSGSRDGSCSFHTDLMTIQRKNDPFCWWQALIWANLFIVIFHMRGSVYMPHGKFEIYKDRSGEYRFRLKAANGQTIAIGQGYSSKASCMKGIASIRKNAPDAEIIELEL